MATQNPDFSSPPHGHGFMVIVGGWFVLSFPRLRPSRRWHRRCPDSGKIARGELSKTSSRHGYPQIRRNISLASVMKPLGPVMLWAVKEASNARPLSRDDSSRCLVLVMSLSTRQPMDVPWASRATLLSKRAQNAVSTLVRSVITCSTNWMLRAGSNDPTDGSGLNQGG